MTESLNKSSYDSIAHEYYDSRHITSRNFDCATLNYCQNHKDEFPFSEKGLVLEVGCGKGSANKYFNIRLERVVQSDLSMKMLRIHPRENSLASVQCNAKELPFTSSSFIAVLAFLFDPYNIEQFYFELNRVLVHNGIFIGTLPHFDWGSPLRKELAIDTKKTRFKKFTSTSENDFVSFDSFLTDDDQIQHYLARAGFYRIELYNLKLPSNIRTVSPHIELSATLSGVSPYDIPIVKLIVARKQ